MKLCCDNKLAINIAHNLVQYDRTKHVEIDRNFIKEKLEGGLICMPYVPLGNQLADVLTKELNNTVFSWNYFQAGNGRYLFSSLRGSVGLYSCK